MASTPFRRKVLIIEDEPSVPNVLYVLLAALGCDGHIAYDARQTLLMIREGSFDAVLLDLRCVNLPPDQMVSAITELRPSLVGRALVITGEIAAPDTLGILERCALPHVPRHRVTSELGDRLRTLRGCAHSHAGSTS